MTQAYVVGFLLNVSTDCVLLVRKLRPAWQHGKLNGIGGKIENGESPAEAMAREWSEETGMPSPAWRYFARVVGPGYDVHFYCAAELQSHKLPRMINDAGEQMEIWPRTALLTRSDVISNLHWLLPLAFVDQGAPFALVQDRPGSQ